MRVQGSVAITILLCLSACHDSARDLPKLWVFYGGETDPFCLELQNDSSGRFYGGGYVKNNPLRWSYHSAERHLNLTFSNLTQSDYAVLKDGLARGRFLAFDSARSTASYKVDPTKPELDLFGWIVVPAAAIEGWQRPFAEKGCPLLRARGGA